VGWLLKRSRLFFGWLIRWRCVAGLLAAVIVIAAVVGGMAYFVPDKLRKITLEIEGITEIVAQVLPATLPAPSKIEQAYWLPQNWTWQQSYWFHHTSQGTTTIPVPYEWFLALERPELSLWSHKSLKDDDYLRRLGFIPSPSSKDFTGNAAQYGYRGDGPNADGAQLDWTPKLPDNPNGLPVGFARLQNGIDPTTGEPYEDQLGLTAPPVTLAISNTRIPASSSMAVRRWSISARSSGRSACQSVTRSSSSS
jgi:hypothetical protein